MCARLAGPALRGPEVGARPCCVKEKGGGDGEIGRPQGGERGWAKPETGREKRNPFPFYFSSFYSNLLKRICKTNLN